MTLDDIIELPEATSKPPEPLEFEDEEDYPDVLSVIIEEMQSDDDALRQNAKFIDLYQAGFSEDERKVCDRVLRMICGWSFETLLAMASKTSR